MNKHTPSKSGQAVVRLKSGNSYEGDVEVGGPWLHFSGRRRLVLAERIEYRPADDHTWAYTEIARIRWIKAAA